jgi:hypothetical protein
VCPDNYRQATVRENWYEEPGSLLAQTLKKDRQRNIKSNLLNYPQNSTKSGNPKEYLSPVWSPILLLGKIPYGLAN